jgi:23S rRNA C2498 (ribose-2'-O)-methylase RlmM
MEASERTNFVRKIHEKTREAIEKKGKHTVDARNKSRKHVTFQLGDMVLIGSASHPIGNPKRKV